MGAFFSNINVHTGNSAPGVFKASLISYLREVYLKNGYEEIDTNDEADRSLIISPEHTGPWITVYDEEFENMASDKFDQTALELSGHFKTQAIGVVIHDSDMFMLSLFNEGELANSVHNMNEDGSQTEFEDKKWQTLVPSAASIKKLKSLLKKDVVFQEERLSQAAEILEMDKDFCLTGYQYLVEEDLPESCTVLNFKKSIQEEKGKTYEPETLKLIAYPGGIIANMHEEHHADMTVINYGARFDGLHVTVVGDSLEKELAEFTSIQIRQWNGEEFIELNQVFRQAVSTENQKLYVATFDNFSLKEGYHPGYPMTTKEYKKYVKDYIHFLFHVKISLKGLKASQSSFQLFFSPVTNKERYCYEKFDLNIE